MENRQETQREELEPLTPEELEARREWYRNYRAAHPEKVKKWEKTRWHNKALKKAKAEGGS